MNKQEAYKALVAKRKQCGLCAGLRNPAAVAGGRFDSEEIGAWSMWQGNLNAEIVVVGQDWGSIPYFEKYEGRDKDQPSENPANRHLRELLGGIGVTIGRPRDPQDQIIFLTNLILCLKEGGLQAPVKDSWFTNCAQTFFKPLMEIIRPRVVIALGKKTSESILDLHGIPYSRTAPFYRILGQSPFSLTDRTRLFPVYHCGAGVTNRTRRMSLQVEDWMRVGKLLRTG